MAFISKESRDGSTVWLIVWQDATFGAGRGKRRKVRCSKTDHKAAFDAAELDGEERAAFSIGGASNRALRAKLLRCYQALEVERRKDAARAGGAGKGVRFDTLLADLVDKYRGEMEAAGKLREEQGGRAGRSVKTVETVSLALDRFDMFLRRNRLKHLTTGDLEAKHLRQFRDGLVRSRKAGSRDALSPESVNRYLRAVKRMLNRFLDDEGRQPYFRSPARSLTAALKSVDVERRLPTRMSTEGLRTFLATAIKRDETDKAVVTRKKKGGKVEEFEQGVNKTPITPWVVLLMLTGCRRGEAEVLRWDEVDMEAGAIVFNASKTGRQRRMLLDSPRCMVSPLLLRLLKRWRVESPDAEWVLPANGRDGRPAFPRRAWRDVAAESQVSMTPKDLRSTWVSYMVSLGRPTTIVAVMAGHSPTVLERNYLSFAHAHLEGETVEDAMQVADLLRALE